jgi:hypothetical protein
MILQVVAKKEQKVKTVKDEFNTLYPDLRLLQTERQRVDWSETILARP